MSLRRKRFSADRPLLPEVVRGRESRLPVVAVLEDFRSAFNVGSIFRTSDAVQLERLVLCGITARPGNPKLAKTALGSEDAVPWEAHETAVPVLESLKRAGHALYAIELTTRSRPLWEIEFPRPVALVFGNEVDGVSEGVLEICDADIEIPMAGLKNSINVATAFGIVVYEIWRRFAGPVTQGHAP